MSTRPLRTIFTAFLLTGALVACGDEDEEDDFDRFQAVMNQANEIPTPTSTGATGNATFTDRGSTIDYTITVNGMTGVTGAHIHPGAAGATGGVIVPLFASSPATGSVNGTLITGSFSATDIRPIAPATTAISLDELRTRMRNGTLYVNVHTTVNPSGEIRGQILPRN